MTQILRVYVQLVASHLGQYLKPNSKYQVQPGESIRIKKVSTTTVMMAHWQLEKGPCLQAAQSRKREGLNSSKTGIG